MPHSDRHRGPNPKDVGLFTDATIPVVRSALDDYCLLLSKGYSVNASLKLVGDKFELKERQRLLMMRLACTDEQRVSRNQSSLSASELENKDVLIDGFNIMITIESALSGGFIFVGRDGCYRDLSSVHGTYKRVQETHQAILLCGQALEQLKVTSALWLLDQPVSNSGRLKKNMQEVAENQGWNWNVELCKSPDAELKKANGVTITTDAVILDSVDNWFNFNRFIIESSIPDAICFEM